MSNQYGANTMPLGALADTTSTPSSSGSTASTLPTPAAATFNIEQMDHPPPHNASTHLLSYYPPSRDTASLLPSQRVALERGPSHGVDGFTASGTSGRHLLDDIPFVSSPRPGRPTDAPSTYDYLRGGCAPDSTPLNLSQGVREAFDQQGGWGDSSFNPLADYGGSSSVGMMQTQSSTSISQMSVAQPSIASFTPSYHNPMPSSSSPSAIQLSHDLPQNRMSNSPFPDFTIPPSTSFSNINGSNNALSDPTPGSLSYPGNLFGNVPLPDSALAPANHGGEAGVTGDGYAQALDMFQYIQSAIPHIRSLNSAAPSASGISFETLLQNAQGGMAIVAGQPISLPILHHPPPAAPASTTTTARKSHPEGKSKGPTKCLGCGATETPEWRRGPMGPRTLCNACGLVHMKMQRKRRKAEEKAAQAAAGVKKERKP